VPLSLCRQPAQDHEGWQELWVGDAPFSSWAARVLGQQVGDIQPPYRMAQVLETMCKGLAKMADE